MGSFIILFLYWNEKHTVAHDFANTDESYRAKMVLVLDEVIRRAQGPQDKSAFQAGKVFVNIEGFDVEVVGASVPLDNSGKRILIGFTADHFDSTAIPQLAEEALSDFHNAKKGSKH